MDEDTFGMIVLGFIIVVLAVIAIGAVYDKEIRCAMGNQGACRAMQADLRAQ